MPWPFIIAASIVPSVLMFVRRSAATIMFATIIATWAVATLALHVFESDNIAVAIAFFFVLLPILLVATSTAVATTLAPKPRKIFDAGFLAMLGWWLGVLVLMSGVVAAQDPWESAVIMAIPAIYTGAGAAFGATNPRP